MTYPREFAAILQLPMEQRLELLEDLLESIAEARLAEPVPQEVINMVREREARYAADPSTGITWEEVRRRLREG